MTDPRTERLAAWLYGFALRREWLSDTPDWNRLDEIMKPEFRDAAAEALRVIDGDVIIMPPPDDIASRIEQA